MSVLLSVIGEPGVGKTTAITAFWLALGIEDSLTIEVPLPHQVRLGPGGTVLGVELGRDRKDFAGTDALSMSVLPTACEWLATADAELVVAEGDRLAQQRFYSTAREAGRRVLVVRLVAPAHVVESRRQQRPGAQHPTWVAGRRTRSARLAEHQGALSLDATMLPARLGVMLAGMVDALVRTH